MSMKSKAAVLLHPVRLRIVARLARDRRLTIAEIGESLVDVPQATLYRHVNQLVRVGMLEVITTNRVRSVTENVYALVPGSVSLSADALVGATREEHLRYFTTFIATLLADFARYVDRDEIDYARDGTGYHQTILHLSDEEFTGFVTALNKAIVPYLKTKAAPGRKRRLFNTIIIPDDGE